MSFEEFKEYNNPLAEDYDVKTGINSQCGNVGFENNDDNPYLIELLDLVGFLEDEEEYGVSREEFYHPTAETVRKVKEYLANKETNGFKR